VSLAEVTARNVAALLEPVARAVAERHAESVRGLNMELSTLRGDYERTARALERASEELEGLRGEVLGEAELRGRLEVAERGRRRLDLALDLAVSDELHRTGSDVAPASSKESLLLRAAAADERGVAALEVADGTLPGPKPSRYRAALERVAPLLDLAAEGTSSEKRLAAVGTLRTVLADALALAE
jgi:hypothetical protein